MQLTLEQLNIAVKQLIPHYLEKSKQEGRNKTMKTFRQLLKDSVL